MSNRFKQLLTSFKKDKQPQYYSDPVSNFSFNQPKRSAGKIDIKAVLAIVAAGLLIISFLVGRLTAPGPSQASSSDNSQTSVAPPKATQNINKEFDFPLKDDKGNNIGSLKYVVESAELNDQIILKGQKNYAVAGREFLIVNLKITNSNRQNVQINSRDYVRLSVNGDNAELQAPDIHNDPVEVQAISTEQTRLGFIISNTDKKLKLIIGEIDGPKTNINLNLQ